MPFNWFGSRSKDVEEKEYVFIWYKQMKTGGTTFYTKPFRTKVKAKSYKEAKDKLTKFAMSKMKLVVMTEGQYNEIPMAKMKRELDDVFDSIDKLFQKIKPN